MIILKIFILFLLFALISSQNYISIVPVTASSSGECGSSFDLVIGEEGSFISYSSSTFTFGSFIANHNQAAVIRRIDSGSITWCREIIGSNFNIIGAIFILDELSLSVFISQLNYNFGSIEKYYFEDSHSYYDSQGYFQQMFGSSLILSIDMSPQGPIFNPSLQSLSASLDQNNNFIVIAIFESEINLFNIGGTLYECPNPTSPPPFHLTMEIEEFTREGITMNECETSLIISSQQVSVSPSPSPSPSPSIPYQHFLPKFPIYAIQSITCESGSSFDYDPYSSLDIGQSVFIFGIFTNNDYLPIFFPVVKRIDGGNNQVWCQNFGGSGQIIGAMWDKDTSFLYISLQYNDFTDPNSDPYLWANEYIYKLDYATGNVVNSARISGYDINSGAPLITSISKLNSDEIFVTVSSSKYLSVNNIMYLCRSSFETKWIYSEWNHCDIKNIKKITYSLNLNPIRVDKSCSDGFERVTQTSTRSPSPSLYYTTIPSQNYISIVPVTASSSGECGSSFDLMIGEEGSFISYSSSTFTFGSFIANHNQAAVIRRIDSGSLTWCRNIIGSNYQISGVLYDISEDSLYIFVSQSDYNYFTTNLYFFPNDFSNNDQTGFPLVYSKDQTPGHQFDPLLTSLTLSIDSSQQRIVLCDFETFNNFFNIMGTIYYCPSHLLPPPFRLFIGLTRTFVVSLEASPCDSLLEVSSESYYPSRSPSPSPSLPREYFTSLVPIHSMLSNNCGRDDLLIGEEDSYLPAGNSIYTFGQIPYDSPILRRIEGGTLQWCKMYGVSNYFVGAMWDKNYNTLYVALHLNDFQNGERIRIMQIDSNDGSQINQIIEIGSSDNRTPPPRLLDFIKESPNYITALFERSPYISVNNQMYYCSGQESDWNVTFTLDLSIIQVDSVCIGGGVELTTRTSSRSPSLTPSISTSPSVGYTQPEIPEVSPCPSATPSTSRIVNPDLPTPIFRENSITLVPAYPAPNRFTCDYDDEFIGGSYFEIGSSVYSFQQVYSLPPIYSTPPISSTVRRIDLGKKIWCADIGGELVGAMWDSDFNSLYVVFHFSIYDAYQMIVISKDFRIIKFDINNGNIIKESTVRVLNNEYSAPYLENLLKENQESIIAIFHDVNNYILIEEFKYYCPNSLSLWTVIYDTNLIVLEVRNDACPYGVIIIDQSITSSPTPSPSPSTSSTSFGSISMFIKNEMTFGCGYDDIQLGGEGTYFNVSDGTTFSFGFIIPVNNPQPILRRIDWGFPFYGVRWCRKLIDQDSINTGKGALYKAAMWDYDTNSLYVILQKYYHIYSDFASMIEVKIMKIDVDTGYAQYETSLYPISLYLGIENPLLIEIYKSTPNIITTIFSTGYEGLNMNGHTIVCYYEVPPTPLMWTLKYTLELDLIDITLRGCSELFYIRGTASLSPSLSISSSPSPSIYNHSPVDDSCDEDHTSSFASSSYSSTSEDQNDHHHFSSCDFEDSSSPPSSSTEDDHQHRSFSSTSKSEKDYH